MTEFPLPIRPNSVFWPLSRGCLAVALLIALSSNSAFAGTNGRWTDTSAGGLWSDPTNWSAGAIADGTDATADFSTLNITTDNTVHLDGSRTVGTLVFGDTTPSNNWFLDNSGDPANVITLAVATGKPQIQVLNQSATISAILAGNQGLFTSGALTLSGANTYSGGTTVGNVTINSDSALGAVPSSPSINITLGFGTLRFGADMTLNTNRSIFSSTSSAATLDTQSFQVIYGGTISGSAGFTKSGSGTLTLNGANLYSGTTTITAGILQLAGAATLGTTSTRLTVNGGALDLNGTTQTVGALTGTGGAIVNNASGTNATLTVGSGGVNGSYAGVIADNSSGTGTLSLIKTGTGTQTLTGLNTYTGPTIVNGGTLKVNGASGGLNSSSALFVGASATFNYQGKSTGSTQSLGQLSFSGGDATVQTTYGTSGNTSLAFSSMTRSIDSTGTFAVSGGTNGVTNEIVVSSAPANSFIDPGVFFSTTNGSAYAWNDAAGFVRAINYSIDPGATTTAGATSVSGAHIQATGPIIAQPTSSFTSLNIAGANIFNLADGAALTVSGILKTGNNAATLSGGAAIQAPLNGDLIIRNDKASDVLTINTPFASNGTNRLTLSGSGKLILGGVNTFNGVVGIANGSLQLGNANAATNGTLAVNVANGLKFGPSIGTFTVGGLSGSGGFALTDTNSTAVSLLVGNNSADTIYGGIMTGSGSLTKVGAGMMTLAAANTYTGGTTINGGTLQVSTSGTLGSSGGSVNIQNGLLDLNGNNETIGALNGTGGKVVNDRSGTQATLTLANNFFQWGAYSGTIADHTTGTGMLAVSVAQAGTETLSGTNTYSGGTTIGDNATLLISSDAALGAVPLSPTPNLFFSFGTLDFEGDFSSAPLNANRSIVTSGAAGLSVNSDMDYGGSISGGGGISKKGRATLRLTGSSTFSGTATVSFGTLELDGNSAGFKSSVPLVVGIGAFLYQGKSTGSAQSLAKLTFSGADATVQSNYGGNGVTSLSFTTVARSTGSTGTFLVSGGMNGVTNKILLSGTPVNSLIDPGVFFSTGNGSTYAWNDSAGFVRSIDYGGDPGTAASAGGTSVSGANVQLNGPITAQTTSSFTTMNINGAYGFTLADGATLTVSGIYKTGGNAAVIGGGAALQALANGELLIRSEKANDVLTINTPIVANGMNQLTLDGPGTLILGAANTFTGNATANSGTLQLGNALALQNNTVSAALTFSPAIGTFIIGGLNAQRFLLLKDTSGNPITLQVGNNGATTTGGGFAGSGALVKIGNGAFNLSSSTFTGGTTINSGTLGIFFEDSLGGIPQSPTTNITFAGNSTLQFLNTIVSLNSNRLIAINPGVTAKIDTPDSGNLGIFIGGVISGAGALTKTGAATLTFSGANTYTGDTTLGGGALILANANALQNSTVHLGPLSFNPSIGSFTLGGLSGAGSLALTDNSGAPVALRVGNNGSSTTFSGVMSGPGSLVKIGAATLTLSGTNTYTGNTIVNAGALDVTGSLAKNDSSAVFISAGPDFGVASLVRRVQSGRSYSGFGATSSGLGMGISADLRGGRSSRASAFDLAMQWRFHDAATDGPGLISDVLSLTGMSSFSGGHVQTDPFPLQMNYNAATLGPRESMLAASGLIDLAWLNSSLNQPNGLWQNATMGNFGTGLQGDVFQNVQSSWDAFASAHSITDANVGDFLGSFGVDVAHHQVWAVVNHNSQFSVVPEPSALVLLLIGGLALSGSAVGRRRRVHGIPWFRRKGSL